MQLDCPGTIVLSMGIFSRMKRVAKSKANAAIDRATTPEQRISIVIMQLEEQRKAAYKELLAFKTNSKQMEKEMAKLEERVSQWEKRAMASVKAGDDEKAKQCLAEKKNAEVELVRIRRDFEETAGYAIELNRSRKKLEAKLQALKLKKGTLATQLAAARGQSATFGGAAEEFERVSEAIDDSILANEAAVEMAALEAEIDGVDSLGVDDSLVDSDDPLMQLKAKMQKERAQLPAAQAPKDE